MTDKEYVGILYSELRYQQIASGRSSKMMLQLQYYEESAKMNGISLCYFRIQDIKPKSNVVNAYVLTDEGYQVQTVPLTKVIYIRTLNNLQDHIKIQSLKDGGITFFNEKTYRNGKYLMWDILSKHTEIVKQIPFTLKATTTNIEFMMKKYNSLIIKPNIGSTGFGLMKLEKQNNMWCLSYTVQTRKTKVRKNIFFKSTLPSVLKRMLKRKLFLVQERINLATYNENSFDIRVVVQRNNASNWVINGYIVKVANQGYFVTDEGQDGTTYTLENILDGHPNLVYEEVRTRIDQLTIAIAQALSVSLPHLGCLGMDIGITDEGTLYFIEVNMVSDFLSLLFYEDKLIHESWKKVLTTPIDYAKYLLVAKTATLQGV